MKLITRKGTMLSCGCELPAEPNAAGLIVVFGDGDGVLYWPPVQLDQVAFAGEFTGLLGPLFEATGK